MLDITQKLVKIDAELDPEDINSIKFLCKDHIPKRSLSKIQDGIEIFRQLERLGKINLSRGEMDYLLECFYRCDRIDLIKKMGFNQVEVQDRVKSGHSNFSAFRILLFEIAYDMDKKDFERSLFIAEQDIPGSKLENIKSIHDLFIQLEKSDILTPVNVNILWKFCEMSVQLTTKVRLFKEKEQQSTGTYQSVKGKKNLPPTEPSTFDQAGTSSEEPVKHLVPRNDVITDKQSPDGSGLTAGTVSLSDRSSQKISSGGTQQQNQQDDVMVRQMKAVAIDDFAVPFYEMKARPRGEAIIINNQQFKEIRKGSSSKDRIGSEKDAENLSNTWTNLGFNVRMYNNLDSVSMIKTLKEASDKDHSKYDCLVVCILSHGTLGYIDGSDGISVKINRLTGFFSGRKSLIGKPKLFFLQACRGDKTQQGHAIRTDAGRSMPDEEQDAFVDGPKELIPDEADFLLGYATVSGHVSYRKRSGSSYIRILTNNLDKFADKLDLLSILTIVNEEVGQITYKGAKKQIPEPMFTLRKKVFFKYV